MFKYVIPFFITLYGCATASDKIGPRDTSGITNQSNSHSSDKMRDQCVKLYTQSKTTDDHEQNLRWSAAHCIEDILALSQLHYISQPTYQKLDHAGTAQDTACYEAMVNSLVTSLNQHLTGSGSVSADIATFKRKYETQRTEVLHFTNLIEADFLAALGQLESKNPRLVHLPEYEDQKDMRTREIREIVRSIRKYRCPIEHVNTEEVPDIDPVLQILELGSF